MFTAYDVQAILSHCPKMNLNLCKQAGLSRLEQMQLLLLTYELYNVYMAQKPYKFQCAPRRAFYE